MINPKSVNDYFIPTRQGWILLMATDGWCLASSRVVLDYNLTASLVRSWRVGLDRVLTHGQWRYVTKHTVIGLGSRPDPKISGHTGINRVEVMRSQGHVFLHFS